MVRRADLITADLSYVDHRPTTWAVRSVDHQWHQRIMCLSLKLCLLHFSGAGYAHRMRRGTKVLPIAILAVLIAVNLVLLSLLLRPRGAVTAQPADQDPRNEVTPLSTAVPGEGPSASTEETASADPRDTMGSAHPTQAIEPAPVERLLLATSSKEAWRATVGDCESPGKIERSTNGGATWKQVKLTRSGPIVRLGAERGGNIFAVGGAGQSCKVPYMSYLNDAAVTRTNSPNDIWFPTPIDRDEVNGPDGTKARPCEQHAVGLAPLDLSRALIVCNNGAVKSTSDAGKTWREVMRSPNTLAVTTGDGRYWLAGTAKGCSGIAVHSLKVQGEESSTIIIGSCAPIEEVATGAIAIDVSGNSIWIWAGSQVQISTDKGRTWT
jgi:hypothetical protein